jgi:hypothetical protein
VQGYNDSRKRKISTETFTDSANCDKEKRYRSEEDAGIVNVRGDEACLTEIRESDAERQLLNTSLGKNIVNEDDSHRYLTVLAEVNAASDHSSGQVAALTQQQANTPESLGRIVDDGEQINLSGSKRSRDYDLLNDDESMDTITTQVETDLTNRQDGRNGKNPRLTSDIQHNTMHFDCIQCLENGHSSSRDCNVYLL